MLHPTRNRPESRRNSRCTVERQPQNGSVCSAPWQTVWTVWSMYHVGVLSYFVGIVVLKSCSEDCTCTVVGACLLYSKLGRHWAHIYSLDRQSSYRVHDTKTLTQRQPADKNVLHWWKCDAISPANVESLHANIYEQQIHEHNDTNALKIRRNFTLNNKVL